VGRTRSVGSRTRGRTTEGQGWLYVVRRRQNQGSATILDPSARSAEPRVKKRGKKNGWGGVWRQWAQKQEQRRLYGGAGDHVHGPEIGGNGKMKGQEKNGAVGWWFVGGGGLMGERYQKTRNPPTGRKKSSDKSV